MTLKLRRKILITILAAGLLVAGLVQAGEALAVPAKAWLSVRLIDDAWTRTLQGDQDARPWPWMDSTPVARLMVPRMNKDFVVMRGTSGAVLAFAPGWQDGTDRPGTPGVSLIAAHRDTHFSFLRNLKKGDLIKLQKPDGKIISYQVAELDVVMEPQIKLSRADDESVLLLSTCYPFSNWQPGGDMRFIVVAREIGRDKNVTS